MKKEDLKWKRVENSFSKDERNYQGKFLFLDLILNDDVEVSYFNAIDPEEEDEIFVDFGELQGIVYPNEPDKQIVLDNILNDIEDEYIRNNKNPSSEFINKFNQNYDFTNSRTLYLRNQMNRIRKELDDLWEM